MSELVPSARVRWQLELRAGSDRVRAVCIDDMRQERVDYDFHVHTLPGLARALEELINRHRDHFPAVLLEQTTVTARAGG